MLIHEKPSSLLVGVGVVVVVLDAPWLKGVDQRHEHQGTHNVLHQVVLVEAPVTSVVANHEKLQRKFPIIKIWFLEKLKPVASCGNNCSPQ